ncbi:MAG TPA: cysteine--tRNA ligase [Candidatus Saccharimonadales bacterium]|nr:cysteine--tRNA ligase [Candidatus Saccharimonadales bacterium]
MKLYNTLTRKTEPLAPLNPPEVTVYTCGPTVYDYAHIGHWFTYIRWDTLIRALKVSELQPNWVMNITDVGHLVSDADEGEDKLEKGARREGKTAWEVAEFYTADFLREMELLHISHPTHLTKATDHIAEQIELVQKLEEKGFTYTISDGVYYDTSKFPRYADFAKLDLEEQQAGARVQYNREKRNPTDFALWKFSPKGQQRDMEWDSPWGTGFPGWHIECSAMSMKYLGETLDIHTGGIDHIPVHHTNEIAQSEAVTGKPFANMWLHSNHVLIEGEKISKSLGNGIRLQDITAKGISLEAFRLHVLESHYRSQSKFSWDSLQAAQNRLNDIYAWADLRYQTSAPEMTDELDLLFKSTREEVLAALQDDLNTPVALAALGKLMNYMSNIPIPGVEGKYTDGTLQLMEDVFGLTLANRPDITPEQKDQIQERELARKNQNWTKSDELRDQLLVQGLGLRDKPYGVQWYRL